MSKFLEFLIFLNFTFFSIPMTLIDLREKRLPNKLMYPGILIASFLISLQIFLAKEEETLKNVLFVLFIVLPFALVSLLFAGLFGMGDVKGIVFLGISLSATSKTAFLISLILSFLTATLYILVKKLAGNEIKGHLPFGPFLFSPPVVLLALNLFA